MHQPGIELKSVPWQGTILPKIQKQLIKELKMILPKIQKQLIKELKMIEKENAGLHRGRVPFYH